MRLSGSNGTWCGRLDELMKYDLVCIAYKNDQSFYYAQENIQSKVYPSFAMTKIDSAELDRRLNAMGKASQGADLKKENVFPCLITTREPETNAGQYDHIVDSTSSIR